MGIYVSTKKINNQLRGRGIPAKRLITEVRQGLQHSGCRRGQNIPTISTIDQMQHGRLSQIDYVIKLPSEQWKCLDSESSLSNLFDHTIYFSFTKSFFFKAIGYVVFLNS